MYMYPCTDNVVSHFLFINHRAWVLVNSKGIYQNLISIPKLALVQPSFEDGRYLCLNAPGMPLLKLDIHMKGDDGAEKAMIKYVFDLHYLHIHVNIVGYAGLHFLYDYLLLKSIFNIW